MDCFSGAIGGYTRLVSRIGKHVTQEEIAEALGVSREWYSLIENGDVARLAPELLEHIARLYEMGDQDRATLYELAIPEIAAGALRRSMQDGALGTLAAVRRFSQDIAAASSFFESAAKGADTIGRLTCVDCVAITSAASSDGSLLGYAVGPQSRYWSHLSDEVAIESHAFLKSGGVGVSEYVLSADEFASLQHGNACSVEKRSDMSAEEYGYACSVEKWRAFNSKLRARSCVAVPLFENGSFRGILGASWREPREISAIEIDVAETISAIITLAGRHVIP